MPYKTATVHAASSSRRQRRDLLDQMLTRFGIVVDFGLNIMQPKQSLNRVLARMMPNLENIQTEQPYALLAQGDTATVFGAALAAINAQVPFGHMEAGLLAPRGYFDFAAAMEAAHLILTDSGGVPEEAPALAKPVPGLRLATERPELMAEGVAQLVSTEEAALVQQLTRLLYDLEHYQSMVRVCMPYGDETTRVKLARLLES